MFRDVWVMQFVGEVLVVVYGDILNFMNSTHTFQLSDSTFFRYLTPVQPHNSPNKSPMPVHLFLDKNVRFIVMMNNNTLNSSTWLMRVIGISYCSMCGPFENSCPESGICKIQRKAVTRPNGVKLRYAEKNCNHGPVSKSYLLSAKIALSREKKSD